MTRRDGELPHNLDAERSVLGGILLRNETYGQASQIICAADFFRLGHQHIFRRMGALAARGEAIDLITLTDELRRHGELAEAGDVAYIAKLVDGVPRSTNLEHYAGIVRRASGQRTNIIRAEELRRAAGLDEEDPDVLRDRFIEQTTEVQSAPEERSGPIVTCLADVQPSCIDWLWPLRLARREITLLVGDGGLGKSSVSLACGAALSRGADWPDGTRAPQGATVILSAEDGLGHTIRPRLDALGADVRHVHALQAVRTRSAERPFVLSRDLHMLEQVIRDTAALLVIVDPIGAYFGAAILYKDTDVRSVLAPLAGLAERTGVCVLAIAHIGKGTERSAQHRVLGSVAFVNAARIVLAIGRHPDDKDAATGRRVLAAVKQNICVAAEPLAFRLGEGGLEWSAEPVIGVTAEQVLGTRSTAREDDATDAEILIRQFLADPAWAWPLDAKLALDAATAHGVNERTLRRAARRANIRIQRVGFGRGGRWIWQRPDIADSIEDGSLASAAATSMSGMADHSRFGTAAGEVGDIEDTVSEVSSIDS